MDFYLYAIRNVGENKFLSLKCKGGKYYKRKNDAINKCYFPSQEVVILLLNKINTNEIKGKNYIYALSNDEEKLENFKFNKELFYQRKSDALKKAEKYDKNLLVFELKEIGTINS